MKIIKLIGFIMVIIVIGLIITNPSKKDFDEFIETKVSYAFDNDKLFTGRSNNYLIWSVYEYKIVSKYIVGSSYDSHIIIYEHGTYKGFCNNFYPIYIDKKEENVNQ